MIKFENFNLDANPPYHSQQQSICLELLDFFAVWVFKTMFRGTEWYRLQKFSSLNNAQRHKKPFHKTDFLNQSNHTPGPQARYLLLLIQVLSFLNGIHQVTHKNNVRLTIPTLGNFWYEQICSFERHLRTKRGGKTFPQEKFVLPS